MKTLLVLSAAVAAASAEADPQFLYHGYAPAAYYNPFLYPTLKKVEMPKMEKEEEMKVEDSDLKTPLVYNPYGFTGSPYSVHPYAFNYPYAYHPYATYAPYTQIVTKAAEEKKVEKREADPYLVYNHDAAPFTTQAYTLKGGVYDFSVPLTYTHHVPLVYTAAHGCQNHMGAAVPCAYGNVVAPAVAAPAPVEEKKVEKREAEADPEAWWYGNYYNNVYAHGHHAYSPYYANAYYAPYHYAVGGCRNTYGSVVPCA